MAKTPYRKGFQGPPPLSAGDWVCPKISSYYGWRKQEPRQIEEVVYFEEADRWTYRICNPTSEKGYSNYNVNNFYKVGDAHYGEHKMAAYEKTKFFAMKIASPYGTESLSFEATSVFHPGDMARTLHTTPLRDHQSAVRADVSSRIQEGDRWLVVQTVCMFEGEPPRPPIRVTEYK